MERATIFYDDDCGFCRWSLDRIMWWDRRGALTAVALQSPEAAELLRDIDPGARMESWHLVTGGGKVISGGAAVAPLAGLLPFGAPVGLIAKTFPRATDRVYQWVARNRGRLSRLGASAPKRASRRSPNRKSRARP